MRTRPVTGSVYGSMARSNAGRKAASPECSMAARAGPAAAMPRWAVSRSGVEPHALADVPLVGAETGGGGQVLDDAGGREPGRYRRGVILRRQQAAERLKVPQVVAAILPEHHAQLTTWTQDARRFGQRGTGAVHESVEAGHHVEARVVKRQVCHVTLMQHSVRAPFGGDPQQVRGRINAGHLRAAR